MKSDPPDSKKRRKVARSSSDCLVAGADLRLEPILVLPRFTKATWSALAVFADFHRVGFTHQPAHSPQR
nr:MAG TPA: hypothetical protein [Caudoviricetes sp.]